MVSHASGTFEVKLSPDAPDDKTDGSTLGRMSIDKQFHGDLGAASKGEMLTAGTGVKGSAVYVAIDQVRGTQRRFCAPAQRHDDARSAAAPTAALAKEGDSMTERIT